MTEKERLAHACPQCHVRAGVRCIDPKQEETPRCHKTRGPGQLDKHLQERIDRQTARRKAEYGPLFKYLADEEVKVPTVEEVKIADRFAVARSLDGHGPVGMAMCDRANAGMQWIAVHQMLNEIHRRCGENWYEAIRAGVLEGFGNGIEYVTPKLKRLMTTTEPWVLAYFRVEDVTVAHTKVRLVPALTWAPAVPLMNREEFEARFKLPDHFRGVGDLPDDLAGLFEQTIGVLRVK